MVFSESWVKHSLEFSHIFSFLHDQFIDLKKKTRRHLIQSTNIKYKLCESQNCLYDRYYSISKTKTFLKRTKRPINTYQVSWKKENLKQLVIQEIMIEQAPGNVL